MPDLKYEQPNENPEVHEEGVASLEDSMAPTPDTLKRGMRFLAFGALVALSGVAAFYAQTTLSSVAPSTPQIASAAAARIDINTLAIPPEALTARGVYVYDIAEDRVLYQKDATAQLPLASLTKAMLGLLVSERLNPADSISITPEALLPDGDWGLAVNDSWTTEDLLDYTLITSSNDGAAALGIAIENSTNEPIADTLTERARELGLSQTFFVNETGLDEGSEFSGGNGSARDVGQLFAYIYTHAAHAFAATAQPTATFTSARGLVYQGDNTNQLASTLPGLVLGKTGFTDLAGGNLAVVIETEPYHPYVIVVLGSTYEERFADVATIYTALQTSAVRVQ